jgi:hypothetical protein
VELAAVALPQAVIALKGEIAVSGDGGEAVTLKAGQAAVAPASCGAVSVAARGEAVFVRTSPPGC